MPKSWESKLTKKEWLDDITAKYLNTSVFNEDTVHVLAKEVQRLEQANDAKYQCRAPGCNHEYVFHSGCVRCACYFIKLIPMLLSMHPTL